MMDNLRSTLLLLSISTVLGSQCTPRMEGGDTVDLLNRLMRTENPWQGLLLHVPDYSKKVTYICKLLYMIHLIHLIPYL